MIPNIPEKTGIQSNRGHSLTDDFITRTYVLPLLTDAESKRQRMKRLRQFVPLSTASSRPLPRTPAKLGYIDNSGPLASRRRPFSIFWSLASD